MRVKAIRTVRKAKYPTHAQIVQNSRLANLTPRNWRANPHVLAALSIIGVAASVCMARQTEPLGGKIVAPDLLNEWVALRIIRDEAKKVGLRLVHKGRHITVQVPSKDGKSKVDKQYCLDETDPKSGISIDFLSYQDAEKLYGSKLQKTPSAAANEIRKSIKNKKVMIVAESPDESSEVQAKKLKKDLREFFKWLKAQGVI